MLDELDKELEKRGHRFCRYADDCNIYVQSERAGQRVMDSVTGFIEKRLQLTVNTTKSTVDLVNRRKFLGYRLQKDGGIRVCAKITFPKSCDNWFNYIIPFAMKITSFDIN